MTSLTLIVPREHLDHPAIGDPAAAALTRHSLQLASQQPQASETALDGRKVRAGDTIDLFTGLVGVIRQRQ